MDSSSAFTPSVLERWRRRENLLPGLALIALAAAGWAYVIYQAVSMGNMGSAMGVMAMGGIGGIFVFLSGWTAMMVAMMVPATLPLILLYRTLAHKRLSPARAQVGIAVMLVGYVAVWATAGLPVYAYSSLSSAAGSLAAVLPALYRIRLYTSEHERETRYGEFGGSGAHEVGAPLPQGDRPGVAHPLADGLAHVARGLDPGGGPDGGLFGEVGEGDRLALRVRRGGGPGRPPPRQPRGQGEGVVGRGGPGGASKGPS